VKTSNNTPSAAGGLDRRLWQIWGIVVGMLVVTVGVLSALMPSLGRLLPEFWLWSGTNVMLPVTLVTVTILLAIYAFSQQRIILRLHARLEEVRLRAAQVQGQHRNRLVAVHALSRTIGETHDPDAVFEAIAGICKDVFDSDRISIMTMHPMDRVLVVRAALGHPDAPSVVGSVRALGEGIAGYVAHTRQPLLLGPGYTNPTFSGDPAPSAADLGSGMVIPIIVRDEVEGVISVANGYHKRAFTPDDLMTLQIFGEIIEYFIRQTEKSNWMRQMIEDLRDKDRGDPASGDHILVQR
jgi:hypothetical protein